MSPFDEAYLGVPPWEIGRPQPAIATLFAQCRVSGRVLDVGCGTGEHSLLAASVGLKVLGVDSAPRAVQLAKRKAQQRGLDARFEVHDALRLASLRERFDSVIDCGLFHVLSTPDRFAYAKSLSSVMLPGSSLHLLCFSDREPNWGGPRRIKQLEIEEAFAGLFAVERIEAARFATRTSADGAAAWLASVVHIGRRLGDTV